MFFTGDNSGCMFYRSVSERFLHRAFRPRTARRQRDKPTYRAVPRRPATAVRIRFGRFEPPVGVDDAHLLPTAVEHQFPQQGRSMAVAEHDAAPEHLLPEPVGTGADKSPQKGIGRRERTPQTPRLGEIPRRPSVEPVQFLPDAKYGSMEHVAAVGLDIGTQKGDAAEDVYQFRLIGVERQRRVVAQETPDGGDEREQVTGVVVHDVEVVHIAAVVLQTQPLFHIVVEIVQVEVAEKLRSQVADRQPASFGRTGEAFGSGQPAEQLGGAPIDASVQRGAMDDLSGKIAHDTETVGSVVPAAGLRVGLPSDPAQQPLRLGVQDVPADAHEVAADVELEHITGFRVVLRAGAYVVFEPFDPGADALVLAAGVAVVDQDAFEIRREVLVDVVVHHTFAEVRRDDLAGNRLGDDETRRGSRDVFAPENGGRQFGEQLLASELEAEAVAGRALMPAGQTIGPQQVGVEFVICFVLQWHGSKKNPDTGQWRIP